MEAVDPNVFFPELERYLQTFVDAGNRSHAEKIFRRHVVDAHASPDTYYGPHPSSRPRPWGVPAFQAIAEKLFSDKALDLCEKPDSVDVEDP